MSVLPSMLYLMRHFAIEQDQRAAVNSVFEPMPRRMRRELVDSECVNVTMAPAVQITRRCMMLVMISPPKSIGRKRDNRQPTADQIARPFTSEVAPVTAIMLEYEQPDDPYAG